jgi:Zn-finger nucleic acid-binding protein
MIFVGAKFCSHCGARADRAETATATTELCPRCRTDLNGVVIGNTNLRECPQCEGIWADAASLEQICQDREKQAAVLGMAAPLPTPPQGQIERNIRYLPCPVCKKLMNRVNFAHCSHVVVDVCNPHGTWFDKDELRRIVEFIRSGGLDAARARELKDLEDKRRQLKNDQIAGAWDSHPDDSSSNYRDWQTGISSAAEFLRYLLRNR